MSEPNTLILVDDDGPTTVDTRRRCGRPTAPMRALESRQAARPMVGAVVGVALLALAVTSYREHRRADRLEAELMSHENVASGCATPTTRAVRDGTSEGAYSSQANTPPHAHAGLHGASPVDTTHLEATAARDVVLGDYRSALDRYRILADGSPGSSVFADLVVVLEREVDCIETTQYGERRCD